MCRQPDHGVGDKPLFRQGVPCRRAVHLRLTPILHPVYRLVLYATRAAPTKKGSQTRCPERPFGAASRRGITSVHPASPYGRDSRSMTMTRLCSRRRARSCRQIPTAHTARTVSPAASTQPRGAAVRTKSISPEKWSPSATNTASTLGVHEIIRPPVGRA